MISTVKFRNYSFIAAIIIIILWVLPYFILGENAHMRVHDNLDSNLAWYEVLKNSGQLWASLDSPIEQIMGGALSREAFYSQFYAMVFLFMIFPGVIAYGLSQLITRIVAFIGMYLLLKKYVVKDEEAYLVQIGAALLFALTPYWPSGMLSILGMPLALFAFLNIRNGYKSWTNYAILTILPFFSSFVLGFFYFLTALGIFWLIDLIRTKKWNWPFFLSILYMIAIYLLIDYRLVISMVLPHEPTNRDVFYQSKNSLIETIQLIFKNYWVGHNQDRTLHDTIILPVALLLLLYIFVKRDWKNHKLFIGLNIAHFLLSTWYAFWFWEGWQPLKEKINILTTYNFSRFHYFHAVVVYIIFALVLLFFWKKGKLGKLVASLLIIGQFFVLLPWNEQITYRNEPSYKQFYAKEQFKEIEEFIGKPKDTYSIVSIGIHPAIAQYNGFYTLDTYNNIYPLEYKHEFRKIIEPELNKNKTLAEYYDHWGGRVYIFVDELGKNYMYNKYWEVNKKIENLQLNTEQLKKMGGEYVFSALEILNAEETNLRLLKVFDHDQSHWRIYLYQVME